MKNIFSLDGPVMTFLNKAADLVVLNILYIVCSIPIITIGASTTALYYVSLRMAKDEEEYIIKDFLHSFKENFKQSTIIWLILVGIGSIIAGEFLLINRMSGTMAFVVECVVFIGIFLFAFEALYVFAVLARFENTVKNTMKNALFISILHIPKSLVMILFSCIPIGLVIYSLGWLPLFMAVGFSIVSYTNSCWMEKIFKKFEPEEATEEIEETEEEIVNNS